MRVSQLSTAVKNCIWLTPSLDVAMHGLSIPEMLQSKKYLLHVTGTAFLCAGVNIGPKVRQHQSQATTKIVEMRLKLYDVGKVFKILVEQVQLILLLILKACIVMGHCAFVVLLENKRAAPSTAFD